MGAVFNKVKSVIAVMVVAFLIISALIITPTTAAFSERSKLLYLPELGLLRLLQVRGTISANVNGLSMAGTRKLTPLGEYYDLYADEELKKGAVVANLKLALTPAGVGFVFVKYQFDGKGFKPVETKMYHPEILADVEDALLKNSHQTIKFEQTKRSNPFSGILLKNRANVPSPYGVSDGDTNGPIKFPSMLGYSGYGTLRNRAYTENVVIDRASKVHPLTNQISHPVGSRKVGLGLYASDILNQKVRNYIYSHGGKPITTPYTSISHSSLTIKIYPSPELISWELASKTVDTKFNPPQNSYSTDYSFYKLVFSIAGSVSAVASLIGTMLEYTLPSSIPQVIWQGISDGVKLTTYAEISLATTQDTSQRMERFDMFPTGKFFPLYASFTDSDEPSGMVADISGTIWLEAKALAQWGSSPRNTSSVILSLPVPIRLRYRIVEG